MSLMVKNFPVPVLWEQMAPGDLAVRSEERGHSLVMKVSLNGETDMFVVLALLSGAGVQGDLQPPYLEDSHFGEMARIDGELVIRPSGGIPLSANDMPPAGALTMLNDGRAFLRYHFKNEGGSVAYVDLATGLFEKASGRRAYYTQWELVRMEGDEAEVLVAFAF